MDFNTFLQTAYFDVIPKRLALIISFSLIVFLLGRFQILRQKLQKFGRLGTKKHLWMLCSLALLLRSGFYLLAPATFPVEFSASSQDESSLINIYAHEIVESGIPLTEDKELATRRPVGYPYLLALFYRIFGSSPFIYVILQITFGVLTVVAAYKLSSVIFRDNGIAFLTGFLMAVYPQNIIATPVLLDEFPFFFFTFWAFYWIAYNIRERQLRFPVRIAIFLSLATLCRTHSLLFPVFIFGVYVLARISWKNAIKHSLFYFGIILMFSVPWGVVTYLHYGSPSISPTYGSIAFYGTLNDRASWHNGYIPRSEEEGGVKEFYNEKNPVKAAKIARKLARDWVIDNPGRVLKLAIMRNLVLFGFHLSEEITPILLEHIDKVDSWAHNNVHLLRKAKAWSYSFILFLGIMGFLWLGIGRQYAIWHEYPFLFFMFLLIIYWLAIHGLLFGFRKYRWFIDLLLIFPASFSIWKIYNIKSGHKRNVS